jgi:hypothetical protein
MMFFSLRCVMQLRNAANDHMNVYMYGMRARDARFQEIWDIF